MYSLWAKIRPPKGVKSQRDLNTIQAVIITTARVPHALIRIMPRLWPAMRGINPDDVGYDSTPPYTQSATFCFVQYTALSIVVKYVSAELQFNSRLLGIKKIIKLVIQNT